MDACYYMMVNGRGRRRRRPLVERLEEKARALPILSSPDAAVHAVAGRPCEPQPVEDAVDVGQGAAAPDAVAQLAPQRHLQT